MKHATGLCSDRNMDAAARKSRNMQFLAWVLNGGFRVCFKLANCKQITSIRFVLGVGFFCCSHIYLKAKFCPKLLSLCPTDGSS